MDGFHSQPVSRYYKILELNKDASRGEIRAAYKKLAMKWHPDKCIFKDLAEPKLMFQEIQEAYAVLSDQKKKALYDCGLYDPRDDDEDVEDFSSFLDEMTSMMGRVQPSQDSGAGDSMEDLQKLFVSMFSADLATFSNSEHSTSTINLDQKGSWGKFKVDGNWGNFKDSGVGNNTEDLQKKFRSMFSTDLANPKHPILTINLDQKGSRGKKTKSAVDKPSPRSRNRKPRRQG